MKLETIGDDTPNIEKAQQEQKNYTKATDDGVISSANMKFERE